MGTPFNITGTLQPKKKGIKCAMPKGLARFLRKFFCDILLRRPKQLELDYQEGLTNATNRWGGHAKLRMDNPPATDYPYDNTPLVKPDAMKQGNVDGNVKQAPARCTCLNPPPKSKCICASLFSRKSTPSPSPTIFNIPSSFVGELTITPSNDNKSGGKSSGSAPAKNQNAAVLPSKTADLDTLDINVDVDEQTEVEFVDDDEEDSIFETIRRNRVDSSSKNV